MKTETPLKFLPTHQLLQAMACTMADFEYNDIRRIYEKYGRRVTPIESDIKNWQAKGVLAGDTIKRYAYRSYVHVTTENWTIIMQTVQPEQLAQYFKDWPQYNHPGEDVELATELFSTAFCKFTHGQDFVDELKRIDWNDVATQCPRIVAQIEHLMRRKEFVAFTQKVDAGLLTLLYFSVFVDDWRKLKPCTEQALLRDLFFDNPQIEKQQRLALRDCYLYNMEFLQTGRLAEVLAKMWPESYYHAKLSALQLLHEGQYAEAYTLYAAMLKTLSDGFFEEPLTNFGYAVAIGLSGDAKAKKEGEKLMKSRKAAASDNCYAMLLALHHYLRADAADFYKKTPLSTCKDRMCWRLSTLFLKHYDIFDHAPVAITGADELVASDGFDYLRLLYADDFALLKPLAEKLRAQTGLETSLLPTVKKLQKWEKVMDQLLKLNTVAPASSRKPVIEVERVAYVINLHSKNVQPKLQKSKDGGITWSKGRNIALKSFKTGGEPCMTTQDHRVASYVECYEYGWYGSQTWELSGDEPIAALVGCQSVYNERTEQRIDIVEEPLQLTVQQQGASYVAFSNVNIKDLPASGIVLTEQGDKQVSVTRVSPSQRKTLELLAEVRKFPKESKQQLTTLLQGLSSQFTVMSPLLKNATDLKRVDACPLIAVQIAPTSNQLYSISLAVKPFATHPPYQRPGKGMEIVSTTIDGERVQTERNLELETQNRGRVRRLMADFAEDETDTDQWEIDASQCLQLLELLRTAQDVAFVEWPQGVRMRVVRPMITADKLRLKISSAGQWFELEGDVSIGDKEKMKVAELMDHLRSAKGNFIRLGEDEYIALSEQLRRQLQAIDQMLTGRGKQLKIATMNGLQLESLEEMGAKVKADEPFRQLISRIREAGQQQFAVPTNLHAELRPYQQEGFVWMSRLSFWGAGACLADDMGLGKTLQAIALMLSRAAQGPQLVLMPTSVLHNWQQELRRFAPTLAVKVLNQQGADRQQMVTTAEAGDVLLSTYGLLVTESELLSQVTWTTVVLDEAHTIKNRDTQTSKGAMQLQSQFRLLLTGTPLQNHLSEIWNLFQFANPGLLGSYQQFADRFILPIERDHDQERQRLLRRLLSPFLLRRTKDDVLNELPEKTEITVRVELSPEEQALYDNLRQQAIANLEQGSKSTLQTLAEITRLRQAACHPRLIDSQLQIPSSKTAAFIDLVASLRQSGHRALVFSQFTSHLALVREELDRQQTPYLYLDGSTTAAERQRLVKQFQTGDTPLFLISLKAGGLGLNLTAADFVVHLDPWWNPAIEDQASDRAHRIGQERPVTVYRLIAANTIEEKIIRLHQNKRSLADALLEDANMFTQISADDVIRLLREGVDAIQ